MAPRNSYQVVFFSKNAPKCYAVPRQKYTEKKRGRGVRTSDVRRESLMFDNVPKVSMYRKIARVLPSVIPVFLFADTERKLR